MVKSINRTSERAFAELLSALSMIAGLMAFGVSIYFVDLDAGGLVSILVPLSILVVLVAATSLYFVLRRRGQNARAYADHCRLHAGQMVSHFAGLPDARRQMAGHPLLQSLEELMAAGMSALVGRRCWVYFRQVKLQAAGTTISHFLPDLEDARFGNAAFDRLIKSLGGNKPELLIGDIDETWAQRFAERSECADLSLEQDLLPFLGPRVGRGWHMPWKSFAIVPIKVHPAALQRQIGSSWADEAEADQEKAEQLVGYLSIACDSRHAFDLRHIEHDARGYAHMLAELLIAIAQIGQMDDLEMID